MVLNYILFFNIDILEIDGKYGFNPSDEYVGSVVFLQSFKVSRLKDLTPNEVVTLNPNPFPDLLQNHYIDVYDYLKSRDGTVITSCNSFTVLINN